MIHTKAFITINGRDIPVDVQSVTTTQTPPLNWNEQIKRMHTWKSTCTGYLTDSEGNYQPTSPIVEGSIEPSQG